MDPHGGALAGCVLLVLAGAGPSKPGLFAAAERRGMRVVLVKGAPTWERARCDDVLPRDCAYEDGIDELVADVVRFARRHRAAGVVTTADAALPALARVAAECGFVGPAPELVSVLGDKSRMRQRFAELGLPSARSLPARSLPDVEAAADRIGFPVVVKPATGTGSFGVMLAADRPALRSAYAVLERSPRFAGTAPRVVVEEFLEGPEVCVDAVVHGKEILFHNVIDKPRPMLGPLFEETEFVTPTVHPADVVERAFELDARLIDGIGLADGLGHTEIRLTSTGPRLVETHARAAGQRLPEIVAMALGVDVYGAAIDLAMRLRPPVDPRPDGYAGYRCIYSRRSGVLHSLDGLAAARAVPGVVDVEVLTRVGEPIRTLPEHNQQNIGFVVAAGRSYDEVREQLERAVNMVSFEVA